MRKTSTCIPILLLALFLHTGVFAQLDPTFGTNGRTVRVATGWADPVETFLLPDGKILVLAFSRIGTVNTDPFSYWLVRFNSDGTVDNSYGTAGAVQLPIPFTSANDYRLVDAVLRPDGKILAVGWDGPDGLIVRLNESGALDTSFSGDGIHRPNINQQGYDPLYRLVVQPDGKIVTVGTSFHNNVTRPFLLRYQENGELDFTFGNQGGFIVHALNMPGEMTGLVRQSTGRFVALTVGSTSGSQNVGRAYRFNADGTLDNGFVSPFFGSFDAQELLLLPDDRMVVGGSQLQTDSVLRDIKLTRMNADGSADLSFGNDGTVLIDVANNSNDMFADVIDQADGSVAVAATSIISKNRSPVFGNQMTLLTVGTTGTITGRSLATDLGGFGFSSNIVRQPDNKLIVTGWFGEPATADVVATRHLGVPLSTYRFHGIPFEFSSSSSGPFGISHPAVFRPSNSRWYASPLLTGGIQFGLSTDIPVAADYLGDFQSELAVFRPSTGTWYIARDYGSASTNFITIQWGLTGDIPAAYDFDGDGKYDVTVFRPLDGNWYIRQSSDNSARFVHWGADGDKPVVGDYDGDGLGDQAVWRPSTGVWYVNRSSDSQAHIVAFGLAGDIPVQEDYDGDLKTDIAVFRPSTGVWYIWRSSDNGFTITGFGLNGDVPVPGDYDGDRKMDIAVFRPSSSQWYRINSSNGTTEQFPWGIAGDIAVQGRY